jgi:hypothetical protein
MPIVGDALATPPDGQDGRNDRREAQQTSKRGRCRDAREHGTDGDDDERHCPQAVAGGRGISGGHRRPSFPVISPASSSDSGHAVLSRIQVRPENVRRSL